MGNQESFSNDFSVVTITSCNKDRDKALVKEVKKFISTAKNLNVNTEEAKQLITENKIYKIPIVIVSKNNKQYFYYPENGKFVAWFKKWVV